LPAGIVNVCAPLPMVADVVEVADCWPDATADCAANAISEVPMTTGLSAQVCSNRTPALTAPDTTSTSVPLTTLFAFVQSAASTQGPVEAT
jgi:hypothetical protein